MDPTISRDEFAALLRRSGVELPNAALDELYTAYAAIESAAARVRAAGTAEPAHAFAPELESATP